MDEAERCFASKQNCEPGPRNFRAAARKYSWRQSVRNHCRGGEIGRRTCLRSKREKSHGGSSPLPGTLDFFNSICYTIRMKKINNTKIKHSINLGLKVLTILAFLTIFMPFKQAAAQATGYNYVYNSYTGQTVNNPVNIDNPNPSIDTINPKSSNLGVGTKTITITGSGFVPGSVA